MFLLWKQLMYIIEIKTEADFYKFNSILYNMGRQN